MADGVNIQKGTTKSCGWHGIASSSMFYIVFFYLLCIYCLWETCDLRKNTFSHHNKCAFLFDSVFLWFRISFPRKKTCSHVVSVSRNLVFAQRLDFLCIFLSI